MGNESRWGFVLRLIGSGDEARFLDQSQGKKKQTLSNPASLLTFIWKFLSSFFTVRRSAHTNSDDAFYESAVVAPPDFFGVKLAIHIHIPNLAIWRFCRIWLLHFKIHSLLSGRKTRKYFLSVKHACEVKKFV